MTIAGPSVGYDIPIHEIALERRSPLEIAACPVCGGCAASPRFRLGETDWGLVVCDECGLGRLWPAPSDAEVASFYSENYYGAEGSKFGALVELLVRWVAARRAGFLARFIPPGGRVLEIGCGRGLFLGAMANRGYEVHGVELNEEAFRGLDPRVQRHISSHLTDLEFAPGHFDEIIIWHVLEHLSDPRGTIREIRRALKDGGTLVLAVPNFSSWQARWAGSAWFHLDLPRHLFHFPLHSLKRLLTDEGFVCVEDHHFSLRQNPFGWLQSALNRWTRWPRNGLYVLLQNRSPDRATPFTKRQRLAFLLAWWLGMPIAFVVSVIEALCRNGATVHVVARAVAAETTGPIR